MEEVGSASGDLGMRVGKSVGVDYVLQVDGSGGASLWIRDVGDEPFHGPGLGGGFNIGWPGRSQGEIPGGLWVEV